MVRFIFSQGKLDEIIKYEDNRYAEFVEIIEQYRDRFLEYGCTIEIDRSWVDLYDDKAYDQRPTLLDEYYCSVGLNVLKNGELFCYDEVEGFMLGESWGLSRIERRTGCLFRTKKWPFYSKKAPLYVTLYTGFEGVKEDIEELLKILEEYKNGRRIW